MAAAFDPLSPPTEDFWVGALRVGRFFELRRLVETGALDAEFERLWSRSPEREVAASVLEEWDSDHGRSHLVLLGWFAEEKSCLAVELACRHALPTELRSAYVLRGQRLMPLAGLLRHAPEGVIDVYYWEAWLSRYSATLRMVGHQRRAPAPLIDLRWQDIAEQALRRAGIAQCAREGVCFERALLRPELGDVILAFRRHGSASVHWEGDDDRARVVLSEDLTFLRVHSHGARVDIATRDVEMAVELASAIGSEVHGAEVTYREARDPLDRERLDAFVRRLLDPVDSAFELHEIVGTTAAYADPALFTIRRSGRGRVEAFAQAVREQYGFARDSRHIDRVRISFQEQGARHRITLFFPDPDEPEQDLALSFADGVLGGEAVERFRAKLLRELGVEIHPRAAGLQRRRRQKMQPPRPGRLTSEVYTELLSGRLDNPAVWQLGELDALAAQRLVDVVRESVFRCGNIEVPPSLRPHWSLTCPCEITLAYRSGPADDEFAQEPGTRVRCDNGHLWSLDRVRPPYFLRVRVSVRVSDAMRWLRSELLAARWEEDEPGVFTRVVPGAGRLMVVVLEEAGPEWRKPGNPRCRWVALSPETERRGLPVTSFAEILGDGIDILAHPLPSPADATASGAGETVWIEPDDVGAIWKGGARLVASRTPRFRLLFALLQVWADRSGPDALATRADLCALDESGTVSSDTIAQLLLALARLVGEPAAEELIENRGRKGIRLRPPHRARGFDLDAELDALKGRSRPRRGG